LFFAKDIETIRALITPAEPGSLPRFELKARRVRKNR
jgi:hypothetical protein